GQVPTHTLLPVAETSRWSSATPCGLRLATHHRGIPAGGKRRAKLHTDLMSRCDGLTSAPAGRPGLPIGGAEALGQIGCAALARVLARVAEATAEAAAVDGRVRQRSTDGHADPQAFEQLADVFAVPCERGVDRHAGAHGDGSVEPDRALELELRIAPQRHR